MGRSETFSRRLRVVLSLSDAKENCEKKWRREILGARRARNSRASRPWSSCVHYFSRGFLRVTHDGLLLIYFLAASQLTERLEKASLHLNQQWTVDRSRGISNKLPRGRNIVFQAFIIFYFTVMPNKDGKEWENFSTLQIFSSLDHISTSVLVLGLLVTTLLLPVLSQEAVTWDRLRIKTDFIEFLLYKLWSFRKLWQVLMIL